MLSYPLKTIPETTVFETDNPRFNIGHRTFMKRILLLSFFLAIGAGFVAAQRTDQSVKISGFVVAVDEISRFGASTYHNMSSETFVVRLENRDASARKSPYIIIRFNRWLDDPHLPSDLFESSKKWRFKVSRSPNCDTAFNKIITVLDMRSNATKNAEVFLPRRLPGTESEVIPLEETLPCYSLSPSAIKSLKRIE